MIDEPSRASDSPGHSTRPIGHRRGSLLATRGSLAALTTLIIIVTGINTLWIRQGHETIGMDGYIYLGKLLKFIDNFSFQGISDLWQALEEMSFGGRPPLYHLLATPFILLFGRSANEVVLINILFTILLLASTYYAGFFVKDSRVGLLAAAFVSFYPPIIHLSRLYFSYFAVVACGALSLCLSLSLTRNRSLKIAWLWGASIGAGMLMHPSFLWIALAPTLIAGTYLLFFQTRPKYPHGLKETPGWLLGKVRDRFVLGGLLPGALTAAALALPWYLTAGIELYKFRQRTFSADLADFREFSARIFGFPEVDPSFWWYAQTAPGILSYPFSILAVAGMIYGLFNRRFAVWLVALTLLARLLLYFNRYVWWHMASALPAAAIVTAVVIVRIRPRWLSAALAATALSVGIFNFAVVTWGVQPWSRPLASALGARFDPATCVTRHTLAFCPGSFTKDRQPWPMREILQRIHDDPDCRNRRSCRLLAVHIGKMSISRIRYILLRERLDSKITIVSTDEESWGNQYNFRALLNSNYLLYPNWKAPERPFYRRATVQFLNSPPNSFSDAHQEIASFRIFKNRSIKIIKRVKPLTSREAEDSVAALDLPDKYKASKYEMLAELHARESNIAESLSLIDKVSNPSARAKIERRIEKTLRSPGEESIASIPFYLRAVERNPSDVNARVRLAKAYNRLEKKEEAIAELEIAIALAPHNPQPIRMLGRMVLSQGRADRAVSLFQTAVEIDKTHVPTYVFLARAYSRSGRKKAAIRELENVITLAPGNPWPRRALANTYRSMGENDKALALYEQVLKIDPDDRVARNALFHLRRAAAE